MMMPILISKVRLQKIEVNGSTILESALRSVEFRQSLYWQHARQAGKVVPIN